MSNTFYSSPPICRWRVLVPEATTMQDPPAHYASPLVHDKSIRESFHSDWGKEYVNEHTVLPRASSTSRYPAPDARPTTTATDVPSPSVSQPLPVSPAPRTSYVDVIENRSPSTRFTEHNSPQTPLLNRTPGNPTLYPMRGGMYWILA